MNPREVSIAALALRAEVERVREVVASASAPLAGASGAGMVDDPGARGAMSALSEAQSCLASAQSALAQVSGTLAAVSLQVTQ